MTWDGSNAAKTKPLNAGKRRLKNVLAKSLVRMRLGERSCLAISTLLKAKLWRKEVLTYFLWKDYNRLLLLRFRRCLPLWTNAWTSSPRQMTHRSNPERS